MNELKKIILSYLLLVGKLIGRQLQSLRDRPAVFDGLAEFVFYLDNVPANEITNLLANEYVDAPDAWLSADQRHAI